MGKTATKKLPKKEEEKVEQKKDRFSIWATCARLFSLSLKVLLVLLAMSIVYLVMCKWVMPPITITQIDNWAKYGLERKYVDYTDISPNVKIAAIASEDQEFPQHWGFDWDAIIKSISGNRRSENTDIPNGAAASTISQQTAKNVFLWQSKGLGRYIRKILEAFYTVLIELIWGKKRILEVYLNTIEMGPGIFGIEAAANHYFKVSAKKLTRSQAAIIISCLPSPKRFTVIPLSHRVHKHYPQLLREMGNIENDPKLKRLL